MKTLCASLTALSLASSTLAEPPVLLATPAAATDLLYARHFTVAQSFHFAHAQDTTAATEGTVVVLAFHPDLLYPRDTAEPVLYAGNALAQRANLGYPSGRLIAVIPGKVDLAATPIWLGTPALPESIDSSTIAVERRLADAASIRAFSPAAIARAESQGGESLQLDSFANLSPWLEALVQEFAADERGESFTR